jgi:hypothetical protein
MKKTVARTTSKMERLESAPGIGEGGEERELCGAYNPPKPESLQVGIEIEVRHVLWSLWSHYTSQS